MAAFQPLRTTEPQDDTELCEDSDFESADAEVFSERLLPSEFAWRSIREVHPQSPQRWTGASLLRGPAAKWGGLLVLGAVGTVMIGGRGMDVGARLKTAAMRDAVMEDAPMQTQQQTAGVHHGCACSHCQSCGSCHCHGHGAASGVEHVTAQEALNTCSTFSCSNLGNGSTGYVAKPGAQSVTCSSTPCSEQDLNTCCVRRQTCDHMSCPPEYVQDPSAESLLCAGATCTLQSDVHLCCNKRASCGANMKCPSGYELKANAESLVCERSICSVEEDLMFCCQEVSQPIKASCSVYTCPSWMYKKEGADKLQCQGTPCTDVDSTTCCEKAGGCTEYVCPPEYDQRPGESARFCKSSVCGQEDLDECCLAKVTTSPLPRAPCNTMICPSGTVKVPNADNDLCQGTPCTSVDAKVCCEAPPEPIPQDCSKMTCPDGLTLKADAGLYSCAGAKCTDTDTTTCCEPKDKPTIAPVQELDCSEYLCKEGTTNVNDLGQIVMCSTQGCDEETCCLTAPQITVPEEMLDLPGDKLDMTDLSSEPMICNLNCYTDVGATDIEIASEPGKPAPDASLEACREACMFTAECQGIVYRKDWAEGTQSQCLGKKNIHFGKCVPGEDFNTEILKEHVMGKCALLGDPHTVQFDRPYGETVNTYSTGDYRLVDSAVLQVDGRFDFTKRFPSASSCVGIAVTGEIIGNSHLVAVYTGPEGWQNGFKVWWKGTQILADYPSEFSDDTLVARFAELDPNDYHKDARHTIGGTEGTLPSFSFEFKNVNMMIYVLLGPDNMNAVIEMEKLSVPQDGVCGNFNCNENDDFYNKLQERGYGAAMSAEKSIFHLQAEVQPVKVVQAEIPDDLLEKCDKGLLEQGRVACGKHMGENEEIACLIDVCMAQSLSVAALDDALGNVEQQVEQDLEQKER